MTNFAKLRNVSIWIAASLTALSATAQEKDYYSKVDPKVRLQILARSEVMKPIKQLSDLQNPIEEDDKNNLTDKIDVVKYLSQKCGFEYTRDANGLPVRPQVKCVYQAKAAGDKFNGMSAKFDCKFTLSDENGQLKERTLKVKYDPKQHPGGGYKEIPQAVLGTQFARVLGFHTGTYCPVDLTCLDCPSDNPWGQSRSAAPPVAGHVVEFKDVVVEAKMKGYKVEDSNNQNAEKPQGASFRDLNRYFPKTDAAIQMQMRAQRDALTLWINFVVSGDADHHNNKLFCLKSKAPEAANANLPASDRAQVNTDAKPECVRSALVINDYGNSFGYSNPDTKLQLSKFARSAVMRSGDQAVTSGASGNAGASNHPLTDAGLSLFIQQAEAVTDQQLIDILTLAQIEKVSDSSMAQWIKAYRKKVERLK